jgi:antitoxin HigA-1
MMAPRFLTPKLTRCLALAFERVQLPDAVSLPGFRLTFEIEGQDATNVDFEDYPWPARRLQMEMFNPPHPGEIIREDCLKPLDLSVTAAAKWLGVSRVTLSELLNGHNGVTAEMAIRLEKAGWGSAESWLRNQVSYDLWQAKKRAGSIKVKRFPTREPV